MKKEIATFAMGCFWTPQLVFSEIPGVLKTEVGYIGGNEKKYPNPSYEEVCSGRTGFAEAVQLTFDSEKIDYSELLNIFWKNHNPTEKNRQGNDIGSQYRSVIFYHNKRQKRSAEDSKKAMQKKLEKKIQTKIEKAGTFFRAEEYHQDFLKKRGQRYCHL